MPAKNIFTFRQGTSSEWLAVNPVLASGEPGYDTTNNIIKIGDGIKPWSLLPTGLLGYQGIQGINGSQGIQGLQGIIGNNGIQGAQGATGSAGSQKELG